MAIRLAKVRKHFEPHGGHVIAYMDDIGMSILYFNAVHPGPIFKTELEKIEVATDDVKKVALPLPGRIPTAEKVAWLTNVKGDSLRG